LFTISKDCIEFYKIICFGLNGFETILKKLQKKWKTEKEKERNKKK
jgi:hypothetical protein